MTNATAEMTQTVRLNAGPLFVQKLLNERGIKLHEVRRIYTEVYTIYSSIVNERDPIRLTDHMTQYRPHYIVGFDWTTQKLQKEVKAINVDIAYFNSFQEGLTEEELQLDVSSKATLDYFKEKCREEGGLRLQALRLLEIVHRGSIGKLGVELSFYDYLQSEKKEIEIRLSFIEKLLTQTPEEIAEEYMFTDSDYTHVMSQLNEHADKPLFKAIEAVTTNLNTLAKERALIHFILRCLDYYTDGIELKHWALVLKHHSK